MRLTNFSRKPIFYGWYVIGALFFTMFLGVGVGQSFGIFVSIWQTEFNTTVSAISIAASIGTFIAGLGGLILGWTIDRIGGRKVLAVSVFLLGTGCLLISRINNVFMLIPFFGILMSFANGGLSGGPPGVIASHWFQKYRGTATSIIASGGAAGGLLFVPFMSYLTVFTNWRFSWLIIGAFILFVGTPLIYFVIRDRPENLNLTQDGEDNFSAPKHQVKIDHGPLFPQKWVDPFKSFPMWQLSISYLVCGITTSSIAVHYVRWAISEDISPGTAALAFGLLSGINAFGVIIIGRLSDKIPRRILLGCVYLTRCLAFLLLVFFKGPTALWTFSVIGGASWLATVPLTSSLTADIYSVKHLGILLGTVNLWHAIGGAIAVYLFGVIFDHISSYDPAFIGCSITLLIAGLLSLSINEKRYSVRYLKKTMEV